MSQQGKSLTVEEIAMLRHVFSECKHENDMSKRTVSVLHPHKRTAQYCGVALSTVRKYNYGKNNAHAQSRKLESINTQANQLKKSRTASKNSIRTLQKLEHYHTDRKRKLDAIPGTRSRSHTQNTIQQQITQHTERIHESIKTHRAELSPKRRKIASLTSTQQQLHATLTELKQQPEVHSGNALCNSSLVSIK